MTTTELPRSASTRPAATLSGETTEQPRISYRQPVPTDGCIDATITAACDVCAHPVELHDPVALRFCAATSAHALTRACLCRQST